MKNITDHIRKALLTGLIVLTFMLSYGQQPPHPPGGATGTGNVSANSQGAAAAGAPIGGGIFILLGLVALYGGRKLYLVRKKSLQG